MPLPFRATSGDVFTYKLSSSLFAKWTTASVARMNRHLASVAARAAAG